MFFQRLGAELQLDPLADRDGFEQRSIQIDQTRGFQHAAAGIADFGRILKHVEQNAPLRRNVTTG